MHPTNGQNLPEISSSSDHAYASICVLSNDASVMRPQSPISTSSSSEQPDKAFQSRTCPTLSIDEVGRGTENPSDQSVQASVEFDVAIISPNKTPDTSDPALSSQSSISSTIASDGDHELDIHDETSSSADSVRTLSHKLSSSTLSPSPASDKCSNIDLSMSTASSVSSISGHSVSSHPSEPGFQLKKRGYMRPQATNFSESAKSRESVLSLGSIAHLQYYFARTGLLDGKGGQLARKASQARATSASMTRNPSGELMASPTSDYTTMSGGGVSTENDAEWDRELAMLPPTVSTYNQKPAYVQPPPDLTMLRRELTEALENALKGLKETDVAADEENAQGWYEIQGLHLLDIITLAIRAAKNYYTAHSQYRRLHAIKSERTIRRELYQVLEILKRMATRNFAGGLRQNEKVEILTWIVGISELIQTEIDEEKREAEERERWSWRQGDWTGREREREHAFIKCFISHPESLPEWLPPDQETPAHTLKPTNFLQYFQDGLRLVQLHNSLVEKSQRQFEIIDKYHTDTNKPYRCAENLRFWTKAAELRWDIMLQFDVMGVVQSSSVEAWLQFDKAILRWSQGVREEFVHELSNSKRTPPRLKTERVDSPLSSDRLTLEESPATSFIHVE